MALNQVAANSLLKQFIAQETSSCPEYFCKNLCTLGLLKQSPEKYTSEHGSDAKDTTYWTYELINDTITGVSCEAYGYEREILGKISNGTIVTELKKMGDPASASTTNTQIIVLGENSGTNDWPAVSFFGIFNKVYGDDKQKQRSGNYVRYGDSLVLWGHLRNSSSEETSVVVTKETVPLFRKTNFTLTFTSN